MKSLREYMVGHGEIGCLMDESGDIVSYESVCALSQSAAFLQARGSLVFCLIDNNIGGLLGYLGLLLADAVPFVLSANVASEQLESLDKQYFPKYLFLPNTRIADLPYHDVVYSNRGYSLVYCRSTCVEINANLALLLGTSGSTGSSKFVRLSKENVCSNAFSIFQYLKLEEDDIPITTLPPSYTYGLSIIHSHLIAGATIAVTNMTFFDRKFWDFFRDVGATSFGGVPYHYEMLKKLRFTKMKLPSLRAMTQAGGQMDPALTKEYGEYCAENGLRFFTMYGQTEATARMSYLPYEKTVCKAGSIGIAIPGGKLWIEDESGREIQESNISGELVYEGKNVSMGYAYSLDDLGKGDELNGILRTGDVAMRDLDGYYYIVGRIKRFIKLFGNRVNLLDVEKILLNNGYDVACVGSDDLLEVYQEEFDEEKAIEIKKRVVDKLKVATQGIRVYAVDNIPRNESGKVQYSALNKNVCKLLA